MIIALWNIINSLPGGLLDGLEDPVMLLDVGAGIYERAHGMVLLIVGMDFFIGCQVVFTAILLLFNVFKCSSLVLVRKLAI